MKYLKFLLMLIAALLLFACDMEVQQSSEIEHGQQEGSEKALLQNQPVPTLT